MEAPNGPENEASSPSPAAVVRPPPPPPPPPPSHYLHLPPHLRPAPGAGLPRRDARLLDLPDDLLLLIMAPLDPLPDLFSLRRTCRRLAGLGTAPELSLLVVPVAEAGGGGGGCGGGVGGGAGEGAPLLPLSRRHRARSCHATLAEAVAAARPGDTVRVSPTSGRRGEREGEGERGGERSDLFFHELSRPVHVSSPLLIRGCGPEPEDTVLRESFSAPEVRKEDRSFLGEAAALRFSAAAVLENLTVVVAAPEAVHHSAGSLLVSRCRLVSYHRGALPHLHAPLATSAVGGGGRSEGGTAAGRNVLRVEEVTVSRRRRSVGGGSGGGGRGGDGSGGLGGGAAVRAQGSGALSSVRALPLQGGGALLWCEIDADKGPAPVPGGAEGGAEGPSRGEGEGTEGFVDALPTAAEVRAAAAEAKAASLVALQAFARAPGFVPPLG